MLSPGQLAADKLYPLGVAPDWSKLDRYQRIMPRDEFQRLLEDVYVTKRTSYERFIKIEEEYADIREVSSSEEPTYYRLHFAKEGKPKPAPTFWAPGASAGTVSRASFLKPLVGVHVAIDPGHIGGEWALFEERWFRVSDDDIALQEGDMTLLVAKLVKPKLEELGAKVTLVRSDSKPLTDKRPEDFQDYARDLGTYGRRVSVEWLAGNLFYKNSEIMTRTRLVNEKIQPDVLLCLHFNAVLWGNPVHNRPRYSRQNHFHVLVNGSLSHSELKFDDVRYEMLERLLQRIHYEEVGVASAVADATARQTRLPPFSYGETKQARQVNDNPFVWARNLIATRQYMCPVVFMEPFVMNNRTVYARLQEGHYEGPRAIRGRVYKSIYAEYADGIVEGLRNYYSSVRR